MKISFVIAVYRNEESIKETANRIKNLFSSDLKNYEYEIIFVDDGSDDGSLDEALAAREQDPSVKVISFTRNFGQMAAITAGLKKANGDAVINISADLQDPIELARDMVKQWEGGSEIVIAYRQKRSDPFLSRVFSRLAYGALRLSVPQLPKGGFDFVLIDRKPLDIFNSVEYRNRFFQGDLLWAGYRMSFIPYERLRREFGVSQYNFTKKLKNFLDAFLDSSFLPIRFMSFFGIVTTLLGILYGLSVVYVWLQGGTPFEGWAPIVILLLVIGGAIMLMLGIIGEYVWRINDEVRKRPNYVVRDEFL